MAGKTTHKPKIVQLAAENKRLKDENKALKTQAKKTSALTGSRGSHRFWKKFAIAACISLAGALLVTGNLTFWVGHTLVDTDRFVSTTAPLIQQPAVQKAIAADATAKLYSNVNVEQIIQDALPPRADFIAPTLSSQIKQQTDQTIQKVLANEKFQQIWNNSIQKSHTRLISFIRTYQGNGTISINNVYNGISKNLQTTKLSFLANKQLPSKVGAITVVQADWLPVAHNIVVNLGLYEFLAISLFLILSILAVWLSKNRRKTVLAIGILYSLLMLATLIAIRIAQTIVISKVTPDFQAAATEIGNVVNSSLIVQTRSVLAPGILTTLIAWITGPYKAAATVRSRIQILLEGHLHRAIFGKKENRITAWVGSYKRLLEWLAVGLIALMLLYVRLTPALVGWYALWMLLIVLVVETIAAPAHNS